MMDKKFEIGDTVITHDSRRPYIVPRMKCIVVVSRRKRCDIMSPYFSNTQYNEKVKYRTRPKLNSYDIPSDSIREARILLIERDYSDFIEKRPW